MTQFQLLDAESQNIKYPKTFIIPDIGTRKSLMVGDYAHITFIWGENGEDRERMWVKVTRRIKYGDSVRYIGQMANDSVGGELHVGDALKFKPNNVCSVMRRES